MKKVKKKKLRSVYEVTAKTHLGTFWGGGIFV
jgi:hypothetical protein